MRDVQEMLREYTAWAFTLSQHSHLAPTFHGLEEELASLPGIYSPPTGRLLVAKQDGRSVGCIALIGRGAEIGELKRLYVKSDARGGRIGARLVAALITEAREIGYHRLILSTHATMEAAQSIYEAAGFHRVATPDDYPEEIRAVVVFMEMDLAGEDR
jgi:ribosomal protein S18 acetylase RimI-like enzyme